MDKPVDKPPAPGNPPKGDPYAEWQAEESQRLNAMAEAARKLGIVVPTGCGEPPPLNPDGSMKK